MPLVKNQSARCVYYCGVVTHRGSISQKTASSTVSKCRATWEKTSQNSRKTGTSMPGCPIWPWRIRPSRLNCPQLMELVHQLLPQPGQAPTQPGEEQAASTPPWPSQSASTSSQMVGLPLPTWAQSDAPEGAPGPLQLLPFTHAGQQPVQYHSSPPVGAAGQAAGGTSIPRASTGQPWAIPASTVVPTLPVTEGLTPAQVPAPLRGKIQRGEYVDLSELLAYDFQYRYSGLDDSQALEVIDGKLSLAPKRKARHLSNLQLWL